jgi:hypothetical protein
MAAAMNASPKTSPYSPKALFAVRMMLPRSLVVLERSPTFV